jgi:hypothetical protein
MRAVNITGKHNIDKLNELGNETYQAVRKTMVHLKASMFDHATQLALLVEADDDIIKSEINTKIQGYKGQDIKKYVHVAETLITFAEVLAKLRATKLTCDYCAQPVFVLYKNVREPAQWTLDRLDNALSHTNENTCISCLKCNLQRRVTQMDKFMFTKKLKINKL